MIILLILCTLAFSGYCLMLELNYRVEIWRRAEEVCNYIVHWEGVPRFQTELVITCPETGKTETIPFIPHYQAVTVSKQKLYDLYVGHFKRYRRKMEQQGEKWPFCVFNRR